MKQIQFKIKFITPLLIHGATSRKTDTIGLTGKALRGCWRFWFRALVGGLVNNIEPKKLLELESKIFGSADDKVGGKFKIRIISINKESCDHIEPGFHKTYNYNNQTKKVEFQGFKQDSVFVIKMLFLNNITKEEIKCLLATIWLWANLGAIGQRARRGFGSPVIELIDNINPFEGLPIQLEFSNFEEIKKHLTDGLKNTWQIFQKWFSDNNENTIESDFFINEESKNANYFILRSSKQITIGNCDLPFTDLDSAIKAIHGRSGCKALGWGEGNVRMSSPIFTRLVKFNKGFVPIATWCRQENIPKFCNIHTDCIKDYYFIKAGLCINL